MAELRVPPMTGWIGVFLVLPGLLALSVRAEPLPRRVVPPPELPSFIQTDPAAGFPNGGRMYCAPAAVSNSLAVLFAAELEEQGLAQVGLIKLLASNGYMYTHPKRGTRTPNQLLRAVQRFVQKRGVEDFTLRMVGIRDCDREFSRAHLKPSLQTIHEALAGGAAVWLNVGWYDHDPETGIYQRDDGHWVTAVGYDMGSDETKEPGFLLIHDPRLGGRLQVGTRELATGRIVGASPDYQFPAKLIHQLTTGFPVKRGADCALLDAVVILQIPGRGALGL